MDSVPGTSFYDGLNKLLIGFLIILPFIDISCTSDHIVIVTLIFITSWITGLLLWCVTESISSIISKKEWSRFLDNKKKYINKAYHDIEAEINETHDDTQFTLIDYYKSYYHVQSKGLLGSIPVLESFSAFFKNLMIVIAWWLILIIFFSSCSSCSCRWLCDIIATLTTSDVCSCSQPCCICIIQCITVLMLCLFIIIIGRYYTERKIIRLVLETYLLTPDKNQNH